MLKQFSVSTGKSVELVDITDKIRNVVNEVSLQDGLVHIHVPHTTAAVTINENADPSVRDDIIMELNKIVPFEDNYKHLEGNSAAHLKSSIIGCQETLIIADGKLILGRWQGIYFCEFDGPRNRKVYVKIM